ncbi:MAG: 16S rRNA (cytidine(1402)-2'-O)-methyltransferase [uncultured Gemmatimonadaceae bacterium]|uniref:Ribosomal RNA small subunit methyltransferase I n=1 Tax=uncultured Gemmatimonadaceae bacterium TaxID=246130 RepID=A0A6J4LE18_9BACT|nr:MAG: 16S rRNA (cytidine(1402)-2'-O)-methyltransferase [uncultured Gemmatimonadaceae bacterium]
MPDTPGTLFVVSTPIGNLGDLTFRAVDVLRAATLIVAEDTRHSRHLLDRYAVETPVHPYHEHNEARATPALVARLVAGERVALISDAGTPLLSDPGARLVAAAVAAGVPVVPVPGASALLAAIVASGIAADRFTFVGFLPRKGRERSAAVAELVALTHTAVVYEAPPRVADTLAELAAAGAGGRRVAVARELTKQFEEVRRGTVAELAAYYEDAPPRGEVVLVLAGAAPAPAADETTLRERVAELRDRGADARAIVVELTQSFGAPRNLAYRLAHEL